MNPGMQSTILPPGFANGARITTILLAIALAGVGGCGAVPQSKYYELTAPNIVSSASPAESFSITLLVGQLSGSHLYREDRLVYATNGEEMGTYQYHRWTEPPTEMMQELLWRSLRASHQFREVNLLASNSRGDFLLQGNLYDFKELSGSKLAARVSIGLELLDMKTGAVVWTHDFSQDEPVNEKDVSAVVAALDRDAQREVGEVATSLNEYFAAHYKR